MITVVEGNLLEAKVEALVNTVNTVGVMGKGIALQFKRAYPEMFREYAAACRAGRVRLGTMHVWESATLDGPRLIINFPTKGHWRSASRIDDVRSGLDDLRRVITDLDITSIAVPPLGCGNGGLDWAVVEPLIRSALDDLDHVDIRLYAPAGAPAAATMPVHTRRPAMTPSRAALIAVLDRYDRRAMGSTPIEVQKLMYFMQELGEPLRLVYTPHHYGPYADALRHVLADMEGHYLSGYGDGSATVAEAEPIRLRDDAVGDAEAMLAAHPETSARVDRLMDVIDGFESMYGLELLATVHWCAHHEPCAAEGPDGAIAEVQRWGRRKQRLFTEHHVTVAWEALRAQGMLPWSAGRKAVGA
ncbi:macro domain-containing protein [Tomitella gaofuii]|uniref:type II toxin-antitoxin system antitoxin DNA ADP-ribosyl glycohydrolase DarG n=1 Tax=Tomitella gaofuii TaxID=2760083 RepID=UPI0015FA213E|nr:macro domain-containing protein [Tomitella gaofuii]